MLDSRHTGAVQDALADCNEAIRLGPPSAAKFSSRGLAYLKLSQWELAVADFNAALQLNSEIGTVTLWTRICQAKGGRCRRRQRRHRGRK